MPARRLVRVGLWRRLGAEGLERFELARDGDGWVLSGTILTIHGREPSEARYQVACDAEWRTRRAHVIVRDGGSERTLELTARNGRWYVSGRERAALRGCVDVDLEWSPSTNTLPIRRLSPPVGGGSGPLRMAWVRFPALTIEPLAQEYRHTSERHYHYESGGGTFRTGIDVDDEGLVVRYQDGWERVGPSTGGSRRARGAV